MPCKLRRLYKPSHMHLNKMFYFVLISKYLKGFYFENEYHYQIIIIVSVFALRLYAGTDFWI